MPLSSIHLRRAERMDADAFLTLVTALAEFEKLPPPDAVARERLIRDAFADPPLFEIWLAFVDDGKQPVGYAVFLATYSTFLALPSLYIEDVFVLAEHRKRGVGGALLRKAVELADERGCGRVEWTALDWNVNARQVYEERLGAQHMSEWCLYRMTQDAMKRYLSGEQGL